MTGPQNALRYEPVGLQHQRERLQHIAAACATLRIGSSVLLQGQNGSGKKLLWATLRHDGPKNIRYLSFDGAIHDALTVARGCCDGDAIGSQFVAFQQMADALQEKPTVLCLQNFQLFADDLLYKLADLSHTDPPLVLLLVTNRIDSEDTLSARVRSRLVLQKIDTTLQIPNSSEPALDATLALFEQRIPGIDTALLCKQEDTMQRLRQLLWEKPTLGQMAHIAQLCNLMHDGTCAIEASLQRVIAAYLEKREYRAETLLTKEARICLRALIELPANATLTDLKKRIGMLPQFSLHARKLATNSLFELERFGIIRLKGLVIRLQISYAEAMGKL